MDPDRAERDRGVDEREAVTEEYVDPFAETGRAAPPAAEDEVGIAHDAGRRQSSAKPVSPSRPGKCPAYAAVGTKCKICGKVHRLPGVDALGGGDSPRQQSPAPAPLPLSGGGRNITPDFKKGKKKKK